MRPDENMDRTSLVIKTCMMVAVASYLRFKVERRAVKEISYGEI